MRIASSDDVTSLFYRIHLTALQYVFEIKFSGKHMVF